MSIKAHVVLEFGKSHIELYRHWGGDIEITGFDLLQKIADAPACKERGHFHDGGYVLRLMLADSDGSLPQYQVVDGLVGQDWSHGYHVKFTETDDTASTTTVDIADGPKKLHNTEEVKGIGSCQGKWTIAYAELDGWETLDDWLPQARTLDLEEFAELVKCSTDEAIDSGKVSDLDIRHKFLSQFKRDVD